MKIKTVNALEADLYKLAARYEPLKGHFERFCQQAHILSAPDYRVKGVTVTRDGDYLTMSVIGRTIRVRMGLDPQWQGSLVIEDMTETLRDPTCSPKAAMESLAFDASGQTELINEFGMNVSLNDDGDCYVVVLWILGSILSHPAN